VLFLRVKSDKVILSMNYQRENEKKLTTLEKKGSNEVEVAKKKDEA